MRFRALPKTVHRRATGSIHEGSLSTMIAIRIMTAPARARMLHATMKNKRLLLSIDTSDKLKPH